MKEHEVSRTLVKSHPELWAECSDASSLARHLDQFGEIRITKLEPETTVAWEGERGSGTVRLEPSGWGTKVILTAVPLSGGEEVGLEPVAAPAEPPGEAPAEPPVLARAEPPGDEAPPGILVIEAGPEPSAIELPSLPARRRGLSRLFGRLRRVERLPEPPAPGPEPELEPPAAVAPAEPELAPPAPEREPELSAPVADDADDALRAALDSLGQAHHRPYSRS